MQLYAVIEYCQSQVDKIDTTTDKRLLCITCMMECVRWFKFTATKGAICQEALRTSLTVEKVFYIRIYI